MAGNKNMRQALRTSAILMTVNSVLAAGKLAVGLVAGSGALVSDGVDSAGDVFSTIIAMIGVNMAGRTSDNDHPYGHEKLESVTALFLAGMLLASGLGIGYAAIKNIMTGLSGEIAAPGAAALVAAGVSIAVKEWLFFYTRHIARRINSESLMATAWNYQTDVMTSAGSFIGVLGARLGFPLLDPIASAVICLLVLKVAYTIGRGAIDRLVDHACEPKIEESMRDVVLKQPGVLSLDSMQTRMFGSRVYVDIAISADGAQSLIIAHDIAEGVHDAIEQHFPDVKHCMVHVNPADEVSGNG